MRRICVDVTDDVDLKKKILWRCKRFDASDQNKDGGVLTYAGTSRCSNDGKKLRTCEFRVKYSRGVVSTMQRPGGEVWTNHLKSIVLSNSTINYIMTSPFLLPSASLPGFPIPSPPQLAVLKVNCVRVSNDTPVFRKCEPIKNVTKVGWEKKRKSITRTRAHTRVQGNEMRCVYVEIKLKRLMYCNVIQKLSYENWYINQR